MIEAVAARDLRGFPPAKFAGSRDAQHRQLKADVSASVP
jgi:hypothetical protein